MLQAKDYEFINIYETLTFFKKKVFTCKILFQTKENYAFL